MFKYSKFLSLLLVLVFACSGQKEQQKVAVKQYSIEQFYKNVSYNGGSFSPDEQKILVGNNSTGVYNAYEIDLQNGNEKAVTQSDSTSVWVVSFFPKDERILFQSDNDGDEIDHIFVRDLDGSVKDLTPVAGAKSQFYRWQRDDQSFLYFSNKRDKRFFDLYKMDINAFESSMIYQNDEGLDVSEVSEDLNFLALEKNITTSQNELYLVDQSKGEKKQISEPGADAVFNAQYFSKDKQYLYYKTNLDGEFTYLMRYKLSDGTYEKVFETNWDVWYAYQTYNGKYQIIGVNEDAKTKISITDSESGKAVDFPAMANKDIKGINVSKSETMAILTVGSAKSPSDKYLYSFESGELKQLTKSLNDEIDENDLVDATVVRFKSYDGLEIPCVYYKPQQASASEKVPALVWVHGGPGGQSRVGYFSLIQYLVNHGYAILAINNRGSSGYGKTFYKMDDQKHGDVDLKDCVAGKEYLASLDYIDKEKIGIIGGSYGGYMVMAALTFEPEVFDVGVNIFGVTNWLRTTRSIPPYWESFKKALYEEMGDPNTEDSVRLYNISPLFHAENVVKPLMVLQGANDPRVLQVESDEIVEAVKANGVPVEYVLFPDEGHGFVKKENEIKGYGDILVFLDKYLKEEKMVQ